jgi:hypothetical protein
MYMAHSPCFIDSPCRFPFCSPFCPIRPLSFTWNPPCCDRIRPPCPQVIRKLTLPFPSPGSYTPHSKIPTPRSFPTPNIRSLGQQCEPSSQDGAHLRYIRQFGALLWSRIWTARIRNYFLERIWIRK